MLNSFLNYFKRLIFVKKPAYEGLTGPIRFDSNGRRKKYSIGVYKVGLNFPLRKIGSYSTEKGLKINEDKVKPDREQTKPNGKINKKLVVVSIKVCCKAFYM